MEKINAGILGLLGLVLLVTAAIPVTAQGDSVEIIEGDISLYSDELLPVTMEVLNKGTADQLDITVTGSQGSVDKTINVSESDYAYIVTAYFIPEDIMDVKAGSEIITVDAAYVSTGGDTDTANVEVTILSGEICEGISHSLIADYDIEDQDGDNEINPGDTIVLSLELEANIRYDDLEITGELMDVTEGRLLGEEVETGEFTMAEDQERDIDLEFEVPDYLEAGHDYEIQLRLTSDTSVGNPFRHGCLDRNFNVDIELEENNVAIRDVEFSDTTASAGSSITVRARVVNDGEDKQENVMVSAKIDELGTEIRYNLGTMYSSDENYWLATLSIPRDADEGTYDLTVSVWSDDADKDSEDHTITVSSTSVSKIGRLILSDTTRDCDQDGCTYTVTLENTGDQRMDYSLSLEGTSWARSASVSPSVKTLMPGEDTTLTVSIAPKAGETGTKTFSLYAEADGKTADYMDLRANLKGGLEKTVIEVLQWIFAAIIVIAIILVIIWAAARRPEGKGKEDVYY